MKLIATLSTLVLLTTIASADPRLWNPPLALRQGSHIEWTKSTARDATGNVLMVWADARRGDLDIYAQLLDPGGVPLWPEGGVRVVTAPGTQRNAVAVAVDGGWIVAWSDDRNPLGETNPYSTWIWAQKLSSSGLLLWPDNDQTGIIVDDQSSGYDQSDQIHLTHDGAGGALIAWRRYAQTTGDNVLTQRILSTGSRGWVSSLAVSNISNSVTSFAADGDGNGNMLVVWNDYRSGTYYYLYAAKITLDGQMPWAVNGIRICNNPDEQYILGTTADSMGGGFVVWRDHRYGHTSIFVQHLNGDGQTLWPAAGVPVCTLATSSPQQLTLTASRNNSMTDGLLIAWEDRRVNSVVEEIYAQKVTLDGAAVWAMNGLKVCGNASGSQSDPQGQERTRPSILSDQAGNLITVWLDRRSDSLQYWAGDIYASRVLIDGTQPWGTGGVIIAGGPSIQWEPALQWNGAALVVYDDYRSGAQCLRTQQFNLSGQRLLPDSGLFVTTGWDNSAREPHAAALSDGRTAVIWLDGREIRGERLYFQIMDTEGAISNPVGGTRLLDSLDISVYGLNVAADHQGGFFVIFVGSAPLGQRIMAIHVNAAGEIDSNPSGEVISEPQGTTDQTAPLSCPDGQGGLYIAWLNYDQNWDQYVYAMRINAACHPVWTYPIQLSSLEDYADLYGIETLSDGSCCAVWHSGTWSNFDISAARMLPQGTVAYNRVICNAPGRQEYAKIISDTQAGAYVVWADARDAGTQGDIYAQRISAQGAEMWTHNGVAVVGDSLMQNNPALATDADGNLFVLWMDYRGSESGAIYGQKLSPAGNPLWASGGLPICTTPGNKFYLQAVSDGGDGLFAVWGVFLLHNNYYGDYYSFGTHLQGNGLPTADPYWIPNAGGPIFDTTGLGQEYPVLVADNHGGFVVVATRYYSYGEEYYYSDLYAQRIRNTTYAVGDPPATAYQFALAQNYPNPFNPNTTISFSLPRSGPTRLTVYNLLGEEVARLTDRVMPAGQYHLSFNGSALSSGIYFYRLESTSGMLTQRMLLLK